MVKYRNKFLQHDMLLCLKRQDLNTIISMIKLKAQRISLTSKVYTSNKTLELQWPMKAFQVV